MKIAIVCPHFPPDNCGVGDHTYFLAEALTARGHTVAVWTAQKQPRALDLVDVHIVSEPWGLGALRKLSVQIAGWGPDATFVQFTPNLFAPRTVGLQPLLPLWLEHLRRKSRRPVLINAHELNHPVGLNPLGLAIGLPQFAQFRAMAAVADHVFFTYRMTLEACRRLLPWRGDAFSYLPVGANVPVAAERIPAQKTTLAYFGGVHPGNLFRHVLSAVQAVSDEQGSQNVRFVAIGPSARQLERLLKENSCENLKAIARATGYVSAAEVSRELSSAHLLLAPYADGISTRRGSAMAGFAHGLAVASTSGEATDGSIPWETFAKLAPKNDADAYAAMVVRLLSNQKMIEDLGTRAQAHYRENFSWRAIAEQVVSTIAARRR